MPESGYSEGKDKKLDRPTESGEIRNISYRVAHTRDPDTGKNHSRHGKSDHQYRNDCVLKTVLPYPLWKG